MTPQTYKKSVKRETTRNTIVQTAYELAQTHGLDGLTIGQLANAVGMSKSGVFAHFGTRVGLQLAVLELTTNLVSRQVFRPAIKHKRGLARLRSVLSNMLAYYHSLAHGCVILSATHEFDDQPGQVRDALMGYLQTLRRELERSVQLALDVGELQSDTQPVQMAFECFGIFLAAHHDLKATRDQGALHRAEKALQRLIDSYATHKEPNQ